jgi:hypothetical protein
MKMSSDSDSPNWMPFVGPMNERFGRLAADALDLLRMQLEAARGVLNCTEAGLLVPSDRPNELRFLASVNSSPKITESVLKQSVPCDQSLAGYVFQTGQLIARVNPGEEDPAHFYKQVDASTGLKTGHYLAVPVMDEGQTLGVATFLNRPPGGDEGFDAREIDRAQGIAKLLAVGLQYYHRIHLQQRWTLADLDQALAEVAPEAAESLGRRPDRDFETEASYLPMLRALTQLKMLPTEHQALAADLIEKLVHHLAY